METRFSLGVLLWLVLAVSGCCSSDQTFVLQGDTLRAGLDYGTMKAVMFWSFAAFSLLGLISAPAMKHTTGDVGPVLGCLLLAAFCGWFAWNEQRSWWTTIDAARGELVVEQSRRGKLLSTERWRLDQVERVHLDLLKSKSRTVGYRVELVLAGGKTIPVGVMTTNQARGPQGAWLQRVFGEKLRRKE